MDVDQIKFEIKTLIHKYDIENENLSKDITDGFVSFDEGERMKRFFQNCQHLRSKYFQLCADGADSIEFQNLLNQIKELRENEGLDI